VPETTVGDVAAVIVLYRPDAAVLVNAGVLAAQVDHVFAVDNTESPDAGFAARLGAIANLTYMPMGDNLGIATALNRGVESARDAGYAWALTMDQDSTPDPGMVASLRACAEACVHALPLGIVSPVQVEEGCDDPPRHAGCIDMLTAITSGDLLSIAAWEAVGGFDEGLFIDQVDHDICLRMHSRGYAVVECGEARLSHRLGDHVTRHFPRTVHVSNHSALRRYYIARNRFEVVRRFGDEFPEFREREMRGLRNDLAKIVLYEDDKVAKLLMSWRGYRDFRRGVTGRYRR